MQLDEALVDLNTIEPRIVKLVLNGEIDPWDIDIAHLCDIYLDMIANDFSLRKSGNALLVAAVLLALKSSVFEEKPSIEVERKEIDKLEVPDIELKIVGREVRRKITIFELVDALKKAFEEEKRKVGKRRNIKTMQFVARDIESLKKKILESIKKRAIIQKVGAVALFGFLSLATEDKLRLIQEDWNGEFIAERT